MAAAGTSGTEPIGAILALVAALEDAVDTQKMMARTARYRELAALVWETPLPFVVVGLVLPTGATTRRAPHIVSFCVRGANRRDLVLNGFRCGPQRDLSAALEREGGVLASGGSACTSDSGLPSHVLAAMCVPPAYIHGSVRLSFGHPNTVEEVRSTLCPALVRLLTPLLSDQPR